MKYSVLAGLTLTALLALAGCDNKPATQAPAASDAASAPVASAATASAASAVSYDNSQASEADNRAIALQNP